jgi:hypothetical protein
MLQVILRLLLTNKSWMTEALLKKLALLRLKPQDRL